MESNQEEKRFAQILGKLWDGKVVKTPDLFFFVNYGKEKLRNFRSKKNQDNRLIYALASARLSIDISNAENIIEYRESKTKKL